MLAVIKTAISQTTVGSVPRTDFFINLGFLVWSQTDGTDHGKLGFVIFSKGIEIIHPSFCPLFLGVDVFQNLPDAKGLALTCEFEIFLD